jgi:hypothetical protein
MEALHCFVEHVELLLDRQLWNLFPWICEASQFAYLQGKMCGLVRL